MAFLITCLKGISGIGAFVILLVGLAMTGITIYGFTHSQIFLNDTKQRSTILGVLMTADLIIVFGSIIGICGLKRSNALMICVFQILVILFLIIFLSLGIAAEVIPSKFFDGPCQKSNNPTLALAYNVTLKANDTILSGLCSLGCKCNIKNQTLKNYNINDAPYLLPYLANNDQTNGKTQWQQCPTTQEERDMAQALGSVEDLFNCAGWCNNLPAHNLFYKFSDINKGKPQGYCYDIVYNEVNKYSNVVGAGSLITAAFLLLITVINICICCDPARKKLSFKDRFVYMKDGQYARI